MDGIIAKAGVTIVERFSRDTGPVLLPERLIDKSKANCERFFYCFVNTLLAALMRVLIVEVVIDYHLVARHFGFTSLCVDHQSRRTDNAGVRFTSDRSHKIG